MLFLRLRTASSNRIFLLNEYWLIVPIMIGMDILIIRKMRSHKQRIQELKRLKKQLENQERLRQVLFLSLGLNGCAGAACTYLLARGGSDFINVDYIKCQID